MRNVKCRADPALGVHVNGVTAGARQAYRSAPGKANATIAELAQKRMAMLGIAGVR